MLKNIKRLFQQEKLAIPIMILILVLLAYGLLIPSLGFYWDDWPFAWLLRFFGPSEFIAAFRPFRPLLGPIFTATTALFGGNPFTWQVIGLIARFLLSNELLLVFRFTWPSQKLNLTWVVLLFTVYPGYQQQWVSLTHVNQELIPFLWLILTFVVTIDALRIKCHKASLTILALVLQALGLFSTEYFFGLEILRFFFLMVVFAETLPDLKSTLYKSAREWLPYLFVWILNAAWTYTFHRSAAYNSYDINILSNSSITPLALSNEILTTISLSGFASWINTFHIFSTIDGSLTQLIALGILILSACSVFLYVRSTSSQTTDQILSKDNLWSKQAILIGLVGIFAGRLPSWAIGLPLKLEFDYDRFMVSIMLGASLFIIGLATFILKDGQRKIVILSLLIGLSTAFQFTVANTFRRDWANQQAFFWELSWRMPAIQKNTVLLTSDLPLKYVSDLQVTAALNCVYAPSLATRELPYALLYIKTRFNSPILPSLQPEVPIQFRYRTVPFASSTSNSIVIYKDADSCLRVLDPIYGNSETVPGASYFLLNAISLSNPNQIQADAAQPQLDKTLFGTEPEHGWCYFYEKAELARQQSDWKNVVKLYNQAQKSNLGPLVPVENLPFIEGFAMTGGMDVALKLTDRTLQEREDLCPAIYTLWDRISKSSSLTETDISNVYEQIHESGCKKR